jgi:hypothetical protein
MTVKHSKFGIEMVDEEYGVGGYTYRTAIICSWNDKGAWMPTWIFFWDKPCYTEERFGLN